MFNNWKMKLGKYSADHPVKLASFVAVFSFVLVFFISLKYWIKDYDGFLENIVVESYGMVFDLLVIGVFVLWLNRLGEKRRDEKRYSEQIDDLRDWNSVEASFQAAGNIRRLVKLGKTNLELHHLTLVNANLQDLNLEGARLFQSNLGKAKFNRSNLRGAHFMGSRLPEAIFNLADLSNANFRVADLTKADLKGANLENANFKGAVLEGAQLANANLKGADLSGIQINPQKTLATFENVKTLFEAKFDDHLKKLLEKNYSQHFQKP